MRNIYTRYHICLMRIKSRRVSLERRFDVRYSSCRYHRYCCLPHTTCILVIVQNITTLLLLLCIWCIVSQLCVCRGSVIIELISRMNSQRGCWVCYKSNKTYVLRIIFRRRFDAKYLHQVSYLLDAYKKPTSIVGKVV